MLHRSFLFALAITLIVLGHGSEGAAFASGEPAASAAAAPSNPLPELPRLAPITSPEPNPGALQELDRLLERLLADDDRTRTNARAAIAEVTPSVVPAIRHRIQDVRSSIDRDATARVIEAARKSGRKAMKGKGEGKAPREAAGKDKPHHEDDDGDGDGDWLDFLLATSHTRDRDWQDAVRVAAMERMLATVGTTPAVRELLAFYAYFGETWRIDLQRQIAKLRDKAVPALIEARQHDAKVVQKFANRELDLLGRAIPGEAVASNDTQILADVLRAYGRTRDVDAVRVVLSFCNSERLQLREASREAIAAVGEPGIWQLRDQYLSLTGNKAPREWMWDRIARELFALYDRARLAEVYKLMDDGVAAMNAGKLLEAIDAFDKVLARSPLFERRSETVRVYVERAMQLEDGHHDDALVMMRKALRLDPKGESAKKVEAEIAYLEGMIAADRGTPDKPAFERALDLDPAHERARRELAALEDKVVERQSQLPRYAAATGVGLIALVAMVLLARRRPAGPGSSPNDDGGAPGAPVDAPIGADASRTVPREPPS